MPILHALFLIFFDMYQQASAGHFAYNPLNESVQMNEDFVGRQSRLGRRVSQRLLSRRAAQAYLLKVGRVWKKKFDFGVLQPSDDANDDED